MLHDAEMRPASTAVGVLETFLDYLSACFATSIRRSAQWTLFYRRHVREIRAPLPWHIGEIWIVHPTGGWTTIRDGCPAIPHYDSPGKDCRHAAPFAAAKNFLDPLDRCRTSVVCF